MSLDDDPRIVLRARIDPTDAQTHSFSQEPFSHRGRRWHLYPFTVYAPTRFRVRAGTEGAMAQTAALWLLGPQRSDGRWPISSPARANEGVAELTRQAAGHGQWAVLVGPATAELFLPRYPSRMAYLRPVAADGAVGEPALARIELDERPGVQTRALLSLDGVTYDVRSPLPGNTSDADPVRGARFDVLGPDGPAQFELDRWWLPTNLVSEDGATVIGHIGADGEGRLSTFDSIQSPDEQRWLVLESVGTDGLTTTDPMMLRVVPETIEGRRVELRSCASDGEPLDEPPTSDEIAVEQRCVTAVLTCQPGDGACIEQEVPAEAVTSFRSTFWDPYERSTYDLDFECESGCAESSRAAAGALGDAPAITRYPVYFAHGFNSSAEAWQPTLELLRTSDARWQYWADAQDVPAFEPVKYRAEQLRKNLLTFLERLRARDAETRAALADPRFDLVCHSKGGLDARVLMHTPEWNDANCGQALCQDDAGQPQSCCPRDEQGRGVPWSHAIASVTTLSTPHHGSSFADWGARLLIGGSSLVRGGFGLVAKAVFGLDEAGRDRMRQTFVALSRKYSNLVLQPNVLLPNPGREYDWGCVTRGGCPGGQAPGPQDSPVPDPSADGGWRLPAPAATATIFSWGAVTCINGACGDIVDPQLIVPFRHVRDKEAGCDEGRNDGVVSTCSARFGIFMGLRNNDHLRWTRHTSGGLARGAAWLFGVRQEPVDAFYEYWMGELIRAGY